jgi:hypothetical protein
MGHESEIRKRVIDKATHVLESRKLDKINVDKVERSKVK